MGDAAPSGLLLVSEDRHQALIEESSLNYLGWTWLCMFLTLKVMVLPRLTPSTQK